MDFKTGPTVTNTGMMVFLGNFYEGQKKEISKCVPFGYKGFFFCCCFRKMWQGIHKYILQDFKNPNNL